MLLFQSIFNKGAVNIPSLLSHITLCHLLISKKLTVCLTMKLNLSMETPPHPSWSRATTCIYKPPTPSTCTSTIKMEAACSSNMSALHPTSTRLNTQNWNKCHCTILHTQRRKSKNLCSLKSHFPAEI